MKAGRTKEKSHFKENTIAVRKPILAAILFCKMVYIARDKFVYKRDRKNIPVIPHFEKGGNVMASDKEEKNYQYYVPENYTNGARLFGFLKTRNAIELFVIAGGVLLTEMRFLHMNLTAKVTIISVTVIPLAIFIIMGVDGCSLTEYLQRMYHAIVHKKYLVRKEAYYSVQAEALYARTTFKPNTKRSRKQGKPDKPKKSRKRDK